MVEWSGTFVELLEMIAAHSELNVIGGASRQLLAEPWRLAASAGRATPLAIPQGVLGVQGVARKACSNGCVTEVVLSDVWWHISGVGPLTASAWAAIEVAASFSVASGECPDMAPRTAAVSDAYSMHIAAIDGVVSPAIGLKC